MKFLFISFFIFPLFCIANPLNTIVATSVISYKKIIIVESKVDALTTDSISNGSIIFLDGKESRVKEPVKEILDLSSTLCFLKLKPITSSYNVYIAIEKILAVEQSNISSNSIVFIKEKSFEVSQSQEDILKQMKKNCRD